MVIFVWTFQDAFTTSLSNILPWWYYPIANLEIVFFVCFFESHGVDCRKD